MNTPVVEATPSATVGADAELRDQLSNLQGLLMLSMLMTESGDEDKIVQLAGSSLPSFACCRLVGVYFAERGWGATAQPIAGPTPRAELEAQLSGLGRTGGAVVIPGENWAWALPLRGVAGHVGYFVTAAPYEPSAHAQFLCRVLAQQTGVALANARLHAKERATAEELRAANTALAETVRALEQTTQIHDRFTRVAVAGEGQEGIARAMHELTGFPVAVEDRYGNLRAWAGPNRPDPYPKDPRARREQMLRRALREGGPVREGGRLVAIASPGADVLGVLALVDPAGAAGDQEQIAIEHGATVLAMELARLRSLAEAELRVRRDLVEELLAGTDEESALGRAQALGYDLERRHRVVVVEGRGRTQHDDTFFHAVRRAAREAHVGSLLVARGGAVVVLSDADVSWDRFRSAILTELGGGRCRVGVGGWCEQPGDFPRSYREAQLALKMQRSARGADRATCYEELGVFQILCEVEDPAAIERFVTTWLGPLLQYDARKHSELVDTLCRYLECGGAYDATAAALSVHRSTLKYRLQRIRDISGLDLTDPSTNFNLQLATRAWQTLQSLRE
jgi:DNA-binding PucR family transcriptional regulator